MPPGEPSIRELPALSAPPQHPLLRSSRGEEEADEDGDCGRNFGSVRPWAGNMMPPSHFDPKTADHGLPGYDLTLDHVFGYRGHASRDNLHWIDPPNTFIYISAAIAVVYDWAQRSQRYFREHTDDITCATYSRTTRLAATGGLGKNNTAPIFVWSVDTCKSVTVLRGVLEFNVHAIAFSGDGSRVLGMGSDACSSVALYDVRSGALLATSRGDSNRILHVVANTTAGSDSRKEYVTVGVSHVKFWAKDKAELKGKKAIGGTIAKQTCVSAACGQDFVYVGNVSGGVFIFSGVTLIQTVSLHSDFCGALAVDPSAPHVLFSGGRDGFLREWDVQRMDSAKGGVTCSERRAVPLNALNVASSAPAGKGPNAPSSSSAAGSSTRGNGGLSSGLADRCGNGPRAISAVAGHLVVGTCLGSIYTLGPGDVDVTTILDSHFEAKAGTMPELWGLDAHPHDSMFATVCDDGTLRLWSVDLGSQILMADVRYPAQCCAFDPDGAVIAVGHRNGAFSVWDATTLTPTVPFTRRREFAVECCSFCPGGRYLALGMGMSHTIDIFDAKVEYTHVATCDALAGNVKALDWATNGAFLRCSTASYEVVHFNTPDATMNQSLDVADVSWATQRCIIGWGVQGIWEGCNDGSDVNTVARSRCGTLLLAGYDSSRVRLYNFPCLPRQTERTARMQWPRHREFRGHSSHITNAVFTHDNKYVLTCGGMDLTILRWRLEPASKQAYTDAALHAAAATASDEGQEGAATDVAGAVQRGTIRELAPSSANSSRPPAPRGSSSARRPPSSTSATANGGTTRRVWQGNADVRSRLLDTTASQVEKARLGRIRREHMERRYAAGDQPFRPF